MWISTCFTFQFSNYLLNIFLINHKQSGNLDKSLNIFLYRTLSSGILICWALVYTSKPTTRSFKKCENPLWKNSKFFITLSFKKNEDISPTKASHTRMNHEHQKLAEEECRQLQQQGLIEWSNSQWACEAFYVNKRAEQGRGKLRLVINYQPLNYFIQDDKVPLPNRNSMFSSIAQTKVFSKFDLKKGFWQLGIDPEDRPKIGFCIPNKHFQWTVMPFGLKTAPSLFQKSW